MKENINHTPAERWSMRRCQCGDPACKKFMAGPTLHAEALYEEGDARIVATAAEFYDALEAILEAAAYSQTSMPAVDRIVAVRRLAEHALNRAKAR